MTIKMSEVFDLPRKANWSEDGYAFLRLQGEQAEFAATAINAYDANQERIAELEAIAFKLQEFIVETYNQYNTDRNLGVKISLRGGELITESESILEKSK